MKLLTIGFEDRQTAQGALDELETACDERGTWLKDLVVAYRSGSGTPRVRQTTDAGVGTALLHGGLLGILVAIVVPAGSVAATVAGGALGGVIAGVGDDAVDNQMMRSLSMSLHENDSVVLALGESEQLGQLDDVLSPYRNRMESHQVPEATVYLIREMSKLSMEDLKNSWDDQLTGP
jgi:uncharacterized membrane protein